MDAPVYQWLRVSLEPEDFKGKEVLEVGSQDVNGSPRAIINAFQPASYTGVDFLPGKGVECVLDATRLLDEFGPEAFDAVVSTEMLEHVRDWRAAVRQMKCILKPGGVLVLTTRRPGFPLHNYPADYWRFTVANLREAFSDFWVVQVRSLPGHGVAVIAKRPYEFWEKPMGLDHIHPLEAPRKWMPFRELVWQKVSYRFRDPATPKS